MDAGPESSITLQLILIVVLTLINAYFAASEMAIVSVNKNKIRRLSEEGNKKAIIVDKIINDQSKMLSAILIGNNLVNIISSALATLIAQNLFGQYAISVATGLLTIVVLIFGEITPKTLATIHSLKISLAYSK